MWFIVSGLCSPTEQEMQQYYTSWGSKARLSLSLYHPPNVFVSVCGQECWFYVWRNSAHSMHILQQHNKSTFPFSFYVACSLSMLFLPHLFFFFFFFPLALAAQCQWGILLHQYNEMSKIMNEGMNENQRTHPCTLSWTWLNLDMLHSKLLG